jgi:hypothetical protein
LASGYPHPWLEALTKDAVTTNSWQSVNMCTLSCACVCLSVLVVCWSISTVA